MVLIELGWLKEVQGRVMSQATRAVHGSPCTSFNQEYRRITTVYPWPG